MSDKQNYYNMVAQNSESTVVAQYVRDANMVRDVGYQSEADLEQAFIKQLQAQAYGYISIRSEADLIANLRSQLEKLNNFTFTDGEWERFFVGTLANPNQSIVEKTLTIQEDYIKNLTRDDGSVKNIYLIKKDNIHDNNLQVINQYATDDGQRANRYDVTVLVNGLPLVHIELKRRGVAIQEAFNQINRYNRESFWASSGLFEYVQIFIISNGTHTKYYSNTTRSQHIKDSNEGSAKIGKRTSNSFEFTSWWADATNRPITDLVDFAKTFFAKHTLLNILTKYCVFTTDRLLLVMRPYQIVATERILNKIEVSTNYKKLGTVEAGGYIWHTTGSGKTLTSFKTAQLVSKLINVEKVVFVVDRKDLDYQTMREYDKFEKGAANSNTSTAILSRQLGDPNARIIVTTIQKLDRFISRNSEHAIFDGHVVLIFDECHRSQFGDMHAAITKAFKNYHIFGFTGTPIFAINASSGGRPDLKTTEQAFGDKLHTYTIVDAIADKNVLPFKVDYVSTIREAEDIEDKKVSDIDREAILAAPERISNIVQYIREHFDQKTKRNSYYKIKDRRLAGFNSIFAVSSIDVAKKYYAEFKKQLADLPSDKQLKVATIYSFGVNDEDADGMIDENSEDTSGLDVSSRDFLDSAIADYNRMFGTSYDTSSDKFQNYYKDVSERVKNREIDILIVVNMFLTGFDATTLNTLWVDKNLRLHGLLQAYSRTNRILNSVKTFGNIICFRNLEKATNESIALFGDKEASGIVLLKAYGDYYHGYKDGNKEVRGYESLVNELQERFPVGERIMGEQNQKDFVKLYGAILRVRNILTTFDEFVGNEILTERDVQDYHSAYIDIYNEFRKGKEEVKENVNDDVVFEMELIKQVDINIDYILGLIKKYHEDHTKNRELLLDINKAIDSSVELRNKKDLINQFIATLDVHSIVDDDWRKFVEGKKVEELEQIIASENLDHDATYAFIKNAFRNGNVSTTGTAITKILPPVSRFSPSGERSKKRESVLDKLTRFFERFFNIAGE
ncbi:DEAD/DEAH box helicase [Candidatus Shapirobacteria bacterium RIFOXYD1_FULL_38_32]|uniref:Type I restriction enzyme endonuclease subunit n=2 Tax=Bacteria candidate phyla TaxID=1783234 RepID=A0A1F7SUR6_9BACT|nr:MAG: Type I site-specific deoxyribonuclease, HsdR family [candidate division WWE3 bacterium GW2011_GWE1_41_72]KKS36759.1 MAG: Type I site-specific deoxyribonuclease, HsdR family [candidate division WWE3 bacterium GW2011_GWF1_42_14]OGL56518.1 MAG: DEAD/DEAH box helicase [Candidatus Shapirobacteria bacterium RIFOXYA1_FULL_39_17]OGL56924.1 MAG: DEAD/DEAH box helicase [Candidatus Shapirobacteria bacterium RIFOXYB1_FULL_38_38]OGL57800.1 MAG: DEAD/DEAH box helicase [Candidatus Shapirobacteria bact